jgi:hypothetical protein
VRLSPAQVHTQQHFAPVLCLGPTGARLDIDIGIIGVHLTGKHAAKFETRDDLFVSGEVVDNLANSVGIVFFDGHLEKFASIRKAGRNLVESGDNLFELCPLLPQRLCSIRFVPDIRLLEFALNLGQALRLALVVKDTSSTHQSVRRDPLSFV